MGLLVEQMTRLCNEIKVWQEARQKLLRNLTRATKERRRTVNEMRAGFSRSHAEMSTCQRMNHRAFRSSLKGVVARHQQELRADLAGARRAWCGQRA